MCVWSASVTLAVHRAHKHKKSVQRLVSTGSILRECLYTNHAHPCIQPSKVGKTYARCTVCSFNLSIKHGGFDDVSKHVKSAWHIAKEGCLQHIFTLSSFPQPSCSGYKGSDLSVIRECAGNHTTNLADAMMIGLFVLGTNGSQEGGEKFFRYEVWQ